jgi:hypothetical protein
MRAKACLRCREYVVIHANNPLSIELVKKFEDKHAYHTVITVDLKEIRDSFSSMESDDNKKPVKASS